MRSLWVWILIQFSLDSSLEDQMSSMHCCLWVRRVMMSWNEGGATSSALIGFLSSSSKMKFCFVLVWSPQCIRLQNYYPWATLLQLPQSLLTKLDSVTFYHSCSGAWIFCETYYVWKNFSRYFTSKFGGMLPQEYGGLISGKFPRPQNSDPNLNSIFLPEHPLLTLLKKLYICWSQFDFKILCSVHSYF